jgi:hypothetical protein
LDKFIPESSEYTNGKENNGRKIGKKRDKQENDKDSKKKQHIKDNHKQRHLKPSENFSDLFSKNSSHCPKAKDSNSISIKFFIKGFCHKACNQAHKYSTDEEKEFKELLQKCRSSDFQQGVEESPVP